MKLYWILAILAFIVLGGAAVVLGGLNQDEGWYLYAANLVAEGEMPYRDFFFTQGPVMPYLYSFVSGVWQAYGLLGARILNLVIGLISILFAVALAYRFGRGRAAFVTFLLLATNLYHLYYLAIPKTYALASLFVMAGFLALSFARFPAYILSALCFVLAAGTRFSLGAILVIVALDLIVKGKRGWPIFALSALLFGSILFGPLVFSRETAQGFQSALSYHAAREGFDPVWTIGSLSRLVRWYLPVILLLVLGLPKIIKGQSRLLAVAFLAVFLVQMAAPFPYEDYQVPIMGLLAVVAALATYPSQDDSSSTDSRLPVSGLLVLSLALGFGSPLLEKWMMNGQDRFWSLKKGKCELLQLRDVAARIETLDPGGKTLLTQDLYLAIETNRKVPRGLEMGPFAMLSNEAWQDLLSSAHEMCPVAALSGYSFAIEPPTCVERPVAEQLAFWRLLEPNYELAFREEFFGQNATALLVLKTKEKEVSE